MASLRAAMWPVFAALITFLGIEAFAGRTASVWFSCGFIAASLMAFWEVGRAKRALGEGEGKQ